MRVIELLAAAAVTVGVVSAQGKTFKFGVHAPASAPAKYLKTDGSAVADKAAAADCTIDGGSLTCGGLGVSSKFGGDMVALKFAKGASSSKWTIDPKDNSIHWATSSRAFSFRNNAVWAESCPHGHFPVHGVAKAYFTEA